MTASTYSYAIACAHAGADPAAARTLGIEVTDPGLAARCGLGNVDPQHQPGARPDAPAAIEACLDHPQPPAGSRLVTIRPDADAFGAMALLTLRAGGVRPDAEMRQRIARIAAADRFDRGTWSGPRPLPKTVSEVLADGPGPEQATLSAVAFDRDLSLADRVAAFARFLMSGEVPEAHRQAVRKRASHLMLSLTIGTTRVELAADGRLAVVISTEPGGLLLGYRLAPVVAALDPLFEFPSGEVGRKYTVARWAEGDADLNLFAARIAPLEAGWGGQAGIKGSPQFAPSRLTMERIVQELDADLLRAAAA